MISNKKWILCVITLIFTTQIFAKIQFHPLSGLILEVSPGQLAKSSLTIYPDADEIRSIQYQLASLKLNGANVESLDIQTSTRYSDIFSSAYNPVTYLSGLENSNPIEVNFRYRANWVDFPGVYNGVLVPVDNANVRVNKYNLKPLPDIPIKIVIHPKTTLQLSTSKLDFNPSSLDSVITKKINLRLSSNSPHWDLYATINKLSDGKGRDMPTNRVRVRLKNKNFSGPWIMLDQPKKILSGSATAPVDIATLEFMIKQNKTDKPGIFFGDIDFLIKDDF